MALYRVRWLIGALIMIGVAIAVAIWAKVQPGYDPYGWLVWGHLTLTGKLDLNGAPSWKPLPYLFTLPYALFGRDAIYMWMVTAFTLSLSGIVFAARVAFRLLDGPGARRYAACAGGLVAAICLIGIQDYPHSILTSESDTVITALCLAAIDCMLHRRFRWAFLALWLASMGRPEAWVPLGLYSLWAWRSVPQMRIPIAIGLLLVPAVWLGIPAIYSKSPFSAANLAQHSPRAIHGNKFIGVPERFLALSATLVNLAAAVATGLALLRRDRSVLLVAGAVVAWIATEIAFALHGWSAVPRYIYETGAGVAVLAGVGVGRVISDLPDWLDWVAARVRVRALGSGVLAGGLSLAVLAVLVVLSVPVARSRISFERADLTAARSRAVQIGQLEHAIRHLGAARILACGQPHIWIQWQSILAYDLGTNVGVLFYNPASERRHLHPIENMYPRPYGWSFFPTDWSGAKQQARCQGLVFKT
jgi:hypothetical protein